VKKFLTNAVEKKIELPFFQSPTIFKIIQGSGANALDVFRCPCIFSLVGPYMQGVLEKER
jgi:hypothetical protein